MIREIDPVSDQYEKKHAGYFGEKHREEKFYDRIVRQDHKYAERIKRNRDKLRDDKSQKRGFIEKSDHAVYKRTVPEFNDEFCIGHKMEYGIVDRLDNKHTEYAHGHDNERRIIFREIG